MASKTGNRCAIYALIDGLDESRSVAEVVAKLKPILNELAYHAVNSESAVLDTREEWHTSYTDALYGEMGADRQNALAARGPPLPGAGGSYMAAMPSAKPPRGRGGKSRPAGGKGGFGESKEQIPAAPPSNRPAPESLTPALRAIMEGTHSSLADDS